MSLAPMKELLEDAGQRKYGVGYFNAFNMEMVRAYIRAAEECHSPIIIGTAETLLPFASFEWITPLMLDAARRASVPVAVHLDHAYTFDVLMKALSAGFGSVMYDGSREKDHADNVKNSALLARIAHGMGASVECELGSVGGLTDADGHADAVIYTEPSDAKSFIEETDVDFLAVSIGTAHGVYTAAPKLDIPRLRAIRAAVDIPLVLHGGSGLTDNDIKSTIAGGISKINVYTDIILAAKAAVAAHPEASYADWGVLAENAMVDATAEKFRLFGSQNMA